MRIGECPMSLRRFISLSLDEERMKRSPNALHVFDVDGIGFVDIHFKLGNVGASLLSIRRVDGREREECIVASIAGPVVGKELNRMILLVMILDRESSLLAVCFAMAS